MKPWHFRAIENACFNCKHIGYPYTDHVWCDYYEFYLTENGGSPEDYSVCDNFTVREAE